MWGEPPPYEGAARGHKVFVRAYGANAGFYESARMCLFFKSFLLVGGLVRKRPRNLFVRFVRTCERASARWGRMDTAEGTGEVFVAQYYGAYSALQVL